jgi:hypothetical protein
VTCSFQGHERLALEIQHGIQSRLHPCRTCRTQAQNASLPSSHEDAELVARKLVKEQQDRGPVSGVRRQLADGANTCGPIHGAPILLLILSTRLRASCSRELALGTAPISFMRSYSQLNVILASATTASSAFVPAPGASRTPAGDEHVAISLPKCRTQAQNASLHCGNALCSCSGRYRW